MDKEKKSLNWPYTGIFVGPTYVLGAAATILSNINFINSIDEERVYLQEKQSGLVEKIDRWEEMLGWPNMGVEGSFYLVDRIEVANARLDSIDYKISGLGEKYFNGKRNPFLSWASFLTKRDR